MTLSYLDRSTYREKTSPSVLARLRARFGEFYLLPEGGSNAAAARGCRELVGEIGSGGIDFDVLCCPCGTGGTLAGVAAGLGAGQRAIGFSVLRGGDFLVDQVAGLQRAAFGAATGNWVIETGFHCGGFARRTADLDEFIRSFERAHALELEWVYVAKMMYGIFALVEQNVIAEGTTVVALVTG
jgi:1-aminocyclopropane-1-carboxylate deaminase/D-cysteine desulfhydrase-like pyridoxal-dependent ACC family enzyme